MHRDKRLKELSNTLTNRDPVSGGGACLEPVLKQRLLLICRYGYGHLLLNAATNLIGRLHTAAASIERELRLVYLHHFVQPDHLMSWVFKVAKEQAAALVRIQQKHLPSIDHPALLQR